MRCYKCGNELPVTGGHCSDCGQAVYTFAALSDQPSFGRKLGGCIQGAPSPKDYRATPDLSNIPPKVDLRPYCSPIEDQGQIGGCTANAAVGAMEYRLRKQGKPATSLSRLFVYFNARRMTGSENKDCGATIGEAMASLLAFGAPSEAEWPYDTGKVFTPPDNDLYQKAQEHVPDEYARIEGVDHVKGSLARGFPVVFGAGFPERFWKEARGAGRAQSPTKEEVAAAFAAGLGHAMLIVGYDNNSNDLIIRNSWGEAWGDKGYFYVSAEGWATAVQPNSTWILGNIEAAGGFTLERPKPVIKDVQGSVKDMATKMRDQIRGDILADVKQMFGDVRNRVKPPENR